MNTLFVAWRSGGQENGTWGPVGRLDFDGALFRFCYTEGAGLLEDFRPFSGMDDLGQYYESDELFPLFANRLLPRSRPEYEAFLRWGGFDPSDPPNPISILGVTEGIRQTDAIEVFPCPMPDAEGCYINKFFLHGVRWMPQWSVDRIGALKSTEPLFVMLDPCNPHDRHAVLVRTERDRTMVGYVPRYLARDVARLVSECDPQLIELLVERVNCDAPLQHRVLCKMKACWPNGFKPCSEDGFRPIPSDVPAPSIS